jgi:hypothetical protein
MYGTILVESFWKENISVNINRVMGLVEINQNKIKRKTGRTPFTTKTKPFVVFFALLSCYKMEVANGTKRRKG